MNGENGDGENVIDEDNGENVLEDDIGEKVIGEDGEDPGLEINLAEEEEEVVEALGGMIEFAQSRVVNGNATTIEHFPWIVSMQYYGSHRCGGSIITTNRILTAAHCTINIIASSLSIRAGSTDRAHS